MRGWGTAGRVSKFQQSNENLSYNEAAADMFLNWVYRKLGLGGFADIDERGEPDDSLPGQARWEWMEGTSEEIGVMEQIFNAHPEWN